MSDIADIDNPKIFNKLFLESLTEGVEGHIKSASDAATKVTRRKLREDAFSPSIIPLDDISDSDLDYFVEGEDNAIICEMEPDSYGAKSISYTDTADTAPYYGDKYLLIFHSHTTPEWTKNVNFLRTYRSDLRAMITDNSLRDLSRLKDVRFMGDVEDIVGTDPGKPSDATGLVQNLAYAGRLDRQNWVSCKQLLIDRDLTNGVFLCNRRTFSEFERWDRNQMGGDMSQKFALEGARALEKASFGGIDFIVTMKTDLVANGVIYQFAPPNYLGRAGVLEKPTMYVKKEKDILKFSCKEIMGCTIANMAAVQKVSFADITGPTGGDGRLEA